MPIGDETVRTVLRTATSAGRPDPRMRDYVLQAMRHEAPGRRVACRLRWVGAAVICLLATLALVALPSGVDVAHAMERRVLSLKSYHGILEMTATAPGTTSPAEPFVQEIWWQDGRYVVKGSDAQLYGDGEQLWEVTPIKKSATLHWDLGEFSQQPYDLRWIAETVSHGPHHTSGKEAVLGRGATRLDGTNASGWPYSVWIDAETNLPLQFAQRYPGGLEQLWRFIALDVNSTIDESLFDYDPPSGWRVDRQTLGQRVSTVAEAQASVDFSIVDPKEAPRMIIVEERPVAPGTTQKDVQMDCSGTIITETRASNQLEAPLSDWVTLGEAEGSLVIFDGDCITWCEGSVAISVRGARSLEIAHQMLPSLKLPDPHLDLAAGSKSKVPIDLDAARLAQQRADAGQPATQLFLEQVVRNFARSSAALTLEASTGAQAVVGLADGPYLRVYLQRPIRPDPTGIWVVAGYDPR